MVCQEGVFVETSSSSYFLEDIPIKLLSVYVHASSIPHVVLCMLRLGRVFGYAPGYIDVSTLL